MYTIVLSIPLHLEGDGPRLTIPDTLARDLLTHHRYEPELRLVVPRMGNPDEQGPTVAIDLRDHPGLTVRFLPWNGYRNSWFKAYGSIRRALTEEALRAEVWHTGCSRSLWDLSTLAFAIGARHAQGLRLLCMDSDPAEMLIRSGRAGRLTGPLVRRVLRERARRSDAVIYNGRGVMENYASVGQPSLLVETVWLLDGELATEGMSNSKFDAPGPARFVVPARLTAWKGVDDVIAAVGRLRSRASAFSVDVVGDGPLAPKLEAQVEREGLTDSIRFLRPVPYGSPFLQLLRGYHAVLVPTRGLEEARVVYDAAASGCVLIHSRTPTLEAALGPLPHRFTHEPGDPLSLAASIAEALARRDSWPEAARAGLRFMQGRTIEGMHRQRARFVAELRTGQAALRAERHA